MKVTTAEKRDVLTGEPVDIVHQMNMSAFIVNADKYDYMRQVARRVRILTHCIISDTDPRTFLYGLKRAGLVNIEEWDYHCNEEDTT